MKIKTISEDYCSFEISKLLQEKGFDERGICVYTVGSKELVVFGDWVENSCLLSHLIAAPTHQMALKWLRETHRLVVNIAYIDFLEHDEVWSYEIIDRNTFETKCKEYEHTYEDAVEASIKYCLTNLI